MPIPATPDAPARIVVLASGAGSTLQALLDAAADPTNGFEIVAVGSDRPGVAALDRAEQAGSTTFVERVGDHGDRVAWDAALAQRVAAFEPDLVVSAGFLKLVGAAFLTAFGGRYVNSHPALSPSFPGIHAPADALAWGVKVTGCTLFVVDAGVDTGPVIDQRVVPVLDDDDVDALHERIKAAERDMLVDNIGAMVRRGWTVTDRKVRINP